MLSLVFVFKFFCLFLFYCAHWMCQFIHLKFIFPIFLLIWLRQNCLIFVLKVDSCCRLSGCWWIFIIQSFGSFVSFSAHFRPFFNLAVFSEYMHFFDLSNQTRLTSKEKWFVFETFILLSNKRSVFLSEFADLHLQPL